MVFCFVQNFFFQNLTIGYMTKTLNQNFFFFPPPKLEYFFQHLWESEYFFRKKPQPPLQVKWSVPYSGAPIIGNID